MKLGRTLIAVALCMMFTFAVTACNRNKTTTEYGLVHGHYVAEVTLTLKNDTISKVSIEEAETPYSWARKNNISTSVASEDIVVNIDYTGASTNIQYARKIKIGDTIFTARANGTENNYVDYFNDGKNGNTSFENWLKVSANAKWYFEQMSQGDYDVLKDDDSEYDVKFLGSGTLSNSDRWLKSKNGYWSDELGGKGWAENMNAISDYVSKNGIDDYVAMGNNPIQRDDNDELVINGVNTGATLVDFSDYMNLVVAAYNNK